MGSLTYNKMNLFDAPEGSILAHACNSQGVWGSGIAKDMKQRFPNAYVSYHILCGEGGSKTGEVDLVKDNNYWIASLITSHYYARLVDTQDQILFNTVICLGNLKNLTRQPIYSNKFNSGLFKVPWEETEKLLKIYVKRYDVDWIVCDPVLK